MHDQTSKTANVSTARGLLQLVQRVTALKAVPRTGWLDRGIDARQVESVADHTLAVAFLAWTSAIERQSSGVDVDPDRVLKLALLHDLAEAETGDSPPYDPASLPDRDDTIARRAFLDRRHVRDDSREATKRTAEDAAMVQLLSVLPEAVRNALDALWQELRAGTSAEARLVKQADRLETFLQSRHYQNADPDLPVESFRQEVSETIDDPLLVAIRDATMADDLARDR